MGNLLSSVHSFVTVDFARLRHYVDLFQDAKMNEDRSWFLRLIPLKLTFCDYVPGPIPESRFTHWTSSPHKFEEHVNARSVTVIQALNHLGANPAHHVVFSDAQARELQRRVELAEQVRRGAAAAGAPAVPAPAPVDAAAPAAVVAARREDLAARASSSDDVVEEGAA